MQSVFKQNKETKITAITFQELTPQNYEECIRLRVRDDQKTYVAPNVHSIAESRVYPELVPLVIYAGEKVVGFLMYGLNRDDSQYWLIRLMIDQRYQGQGYGQEAMHKIISVMSALPGCQSIYLSYEPDNNVAGQLYTSLGFKLTGEEIEGEVVACLKLEN